MQLPPSPCSDRLWGQFLATVRRSVDRRNYSAWIARLTLKEIGEDGMVVGAPSAFVKSLVERRFLPVLEQAARSCLGNGTHFTISCPSRPQPVPAGEPDRVSELPDPPRSSADPLNGPRFSELDDDPRSEASGRPPVTAKLRLNEKYVFDNFVVGPSNELSHAACLRVISSPAVSYNPLFIHGDSGLGKTHLLQATCRGLLERHSSLRVLYISCEDFMNRFVDALNRRSLPSFRRDLRQVDCLAIDDVHFLSKKKRMQEEFFHTFNALYDAKKQIVLSSDSKPRDMSDFEDRLLTRFQWGLMTSIDPPTHETRRRIAHRKARAHDRILPDEVSEFVADLAHRSVRELEGAVVKLVATANLQDREIDLGFAQEALSDLASSSPRPPSLAELASEVASRFGVTVTDLKSARRSRSILVPRQVGIYLSKLLTPASLSEIGAFYGGRDHSTVLNSLKRAEHLMVSEHRVKDTVDRVAGRYNRRVSP